jgi:uncharacterized iron-regulated membrane protein
MFKPAVVAYKLHKWIGLFVGLQVLIWLGTGVYMVVVDIDFIHGDSLVKNMQQAVTLPQTSRFSMATLRTSDPEAIRIDLRPVMGKTYYVVTTSAKRYLLDPQSGQVVSPLGEDVAREIAEFHFNGDALVIRASLITSNPPMEIQTRPLPLWRIDFDDRFSTSFYIDPYTGSLATRRHQYWRVFDFLWMLHIMDYEERTDAHNLLLITAQVTGLVLAITGLWLLFYRLGGHRNNRRRKERVTSR